MTSTPLDTGSPFPRSTLVNAATAGAKQVAFHPGNFMLFDPEQPHKDANQLAAELGGLTDPNEVQHNCPGCNKSFEWEIFKAHALPCYRKWWKVAAGWRKHRSFKGATLVVPPESELIIPETKP